MGELYESPAIARMVEEQWKKWLLLTQRKTGERHDPKPFPTVTISRERGSGGGLIGQQVAEQLRFHLLDSEIVDYVARSASVDRLAVEHMDEQSQRSIKEKAERVIQQRAFSSQSYMAHLTKAISAVGEKGRAVVVGRGAHLILPPNRCFRVRTIAPPEVRIQRLCAHAGLPPPEAERMITETDRQRTQFIQENFHQSDGNPLLYDLVINTGEIAIETASELIVKAVLARFPQVHETKAEAAKI